MRKHPMTVRCEIALQRAEKALAKAKAEKVAADAALAEAEDDVRAARYDLSINQELDARRAVSA